MLRAVQQADPRYDGRFFYGVTSTGVFCFPSCTCRKPRPENVRFFRSQEEAVAAGFRPCKRCRPDLAEGRTAQDAELIARAKRLVDAELDTITVDRLARQLALSPDYFKRLFRRIAGVPPHEYILRRRTARAVELLRAGDLPLLEVGDAVGFRSVSGFYGAFRRVVGVPPGEYRQANRARVGGPRR